MSQLVFSVHQNPKVDSNASEGTDLSARTSGQKDALYLGCQVEGMTQVKDGSSHSKISRLKLSLSTSNV